MPKTGARWAENEAIAISEHGKHEETCAALDLRIARVLSTKARSLRESGRIAESIAVSTEIAERFGDADAPELRKLVTVALAARALLLEGTGQEAEAIVLSDALIARLRHESDPREQVLLASWLAGQGAALIAQERYAEAIELLDALIDRFEDSPEPELRREVAFALSNKATALACLGREEEALSVHEDRVSRFGEETLTLFDEAIERLANDPEGQGRAELLRQLRGEMGGDGDPAS